MTPVDKIGLLKCSHLFDSKRYLNAYWTIRRQTNSRSVKSQTSQLADSDINWIVLSAGLASLTIQQPQLLSCTMS